MAAGSSFDTYREAILLLGTAGVVIPLFKRFRFSPTLGFLLAGMLLGPFVTGRLVEVLPFLKILALSDPEQLGHVGEFGVVFLFFMIGLELSLERLRILRRQVLRFGAGQFLISTAVIGVVLWLWGQKAIASLVIGSALAMSSTAIVIPTLAERKKMATAGGRIIFSVLLFQDLAVTPLLIMVSLLANGQSGAIDQAGALWTLAQAALGVALLVIGGRVVLRPLFQSVALAKDHEFFMAASLLVVLGAAVAAQAMGLSMAIGAFVGGILLAETEFRRQIEATIDPFRGLLLGLFFISIGAKLDLALLSQNPGQIITMMLAFVLLKAAVMYALTMRVKIRGVVRHEVAWLLAPGGEFAFVLLASGMASGLVWPTIGSKLLVAVTLSMFFIPVIALVIGRMERIGEHGQEKTFDEIDEDAAEGGVIVIGCGRVGTLVAEMLARHKVPAFCVDTNPRNVAQARSEGLKAYFGDPLVPQFMDRLHLENARALVLTLNNPSAVETILTTARRAHPTLTIVARARDRNHAQKLYELGVTDAVPETFEASLQLSEAVLVDVGVPMGLVIASVHDKRDKTRKRLKTASGEEVKAPQAVRRLKAGE